MNRKDYHIGPGAASLLLIVVMLSMSVLGMLAMMNARSDYRLSARSIEVTEQIYTLSTAAERSLASLDKIIADSAAEAENDTQWLQILADRLPAGMTMEDREISWTVQTTEGRSVLCAVKLADWGQTPRVHWTRHQLFTQLEQLEQEESTWQIWF